VPNVVSPRFEFGNTAPAPGRGFFFLMRVKAEHRQSCMS